MEYRILYKEDIPFPLFLERVEYPNERFIYVIRQCVYVTLYRYIYNCERTTTK